MTLREYLEGCYPQMMHAVRKPVFREEITALDVFEIEDIPPEKKKASQQSSILQKKGEGESVFSNPQQYKVYIIDFESYIDSFKKGSRASEGEKCDFILSDLEMQSWIVLNELSTGQSEYLAKKEKKARLQFDSTIAKLSLDKNTPRPFLSQFTYKVALLSYRFASSEGESLVAKASNAFSKSSLIAKNITLEELFPEGFVWVQCIYPEPFELSDIFLQEVCESHF